MRSWGVIIASFIFCFTMTAQPAMAGTMYATTEVNVRDLPDLDAEIRTTLETGDQVEVVAMVERDRNWAIVEHDGVLRAVCADYLSEDEPEPASYFYGTCRVTHYCPCARCCGKADGITASGARATVNRTVACDLPFGTRLLINGQEYVVEDRGVSGMWVDIFVGSHDEACALGEYYADVYILED